MEFLAIGFLLLIYFLPTIISGNRQHRNAGAVFALNLLLGWTLLGWVAAFVWSVSAQGEASGGVADAASSPPARGVVGEIEQLQALREKGALSEEEFAALKARALHGEPVQGAAAQKSPDVVY